jgi:hypothetical protein
MSMDSILARTTSCQVTMDANRHLFNKINGNTYTSAECEQILREVTTNGLNAADAMLADGLNIQQLVEEKDNKVNTMKGNKVWKAQQIIAESKKETDKANEGKTEEDKVDQPFTTDTVSLAQAEAEERNLSTRVVTGIKEGVAKSLTEIFGMDVVHSVTHDEEGSCKKPIDDWKLHDIYTAIRAAAVKPTPQYVLNMLINFLKFKFHFKKSALENLNKINTIVTSLKNNGAKIDPSIIALIIMNNYTYAAANPTWGTEYARVLEEARNTFGPKYEHTPESVEDLIGLAKKADAVRNRDKAPSPDTMSANQQQEVHNIFQAVGYETDSYDDEASSAMSAESSSVDTRNTRSRSRRNNNNRNRDRSRSRARDGEEEWTVENQPCPHCKAVGKKGRHVGIANEKCYLNPEVKGFIPKWAFDLKNKKE